ncbi:hypothetical protein GCM10011575_24150 [Microlunatus endophyticus]|uniref:Peptidase inhibitor family I36 n=1 Tax=Microlunatus endophyticus TaxID=1716077 RepID=A0A917W402_9ACTN|nr:hypothetical protein [Microlunatus endophyticus]GGL64933.1 hypothetical protein GCM10011575_24150 [Microlunatus endophyticus]
MPSNPRATQVTAALATAVAGLVTGLAVMPPATAAPLPPAEGGFTGTSSWQCTQVDGVQACARVEYDPKTHRVRAQSWATDQRGGANWTVNAGKTRIVVGDRTNVTPRRTTGPNAPGFRIKHPKVAGRVDNPDTAARRDDDYSRWVGAVAGYYRTTTVVQARAGKRRIQIPVTSGPWTRFQ